MTDEIFKILVEGFSSFLFNLLLVVTLSIIIWKEQERVARFLDKLGIKGVGVSAQGLKFERFEQQVEAAYVKQELGRPSESDKRRIRNIREHLAPVASGRRLLWVDDAPAGNERERSAFVDMQIDVQSCRSTTEAIRELKDPEQHFDVIISDWHRPSDDKPDQPAGIGLLEALRKGGLETPLVFYHGKVTQTELAQRRQLARHAGAIGTTGSPGELLAWTVAELVKAAMDEQSTY